MSVEFTTSGSLRTPLSKKYMAVLAKHFARKVNVEMETSNALVHFPMGFCTIKAEGEDLSFICRANTEDALAAVVSIIDGHVHMLKKIPDREINWRPM